MNINLKTEFNELNEREQKEFVAHLVHAIRNFPHAFMIAKSILTLSKKYDVFDRVKFNKDESNN